MSARAAALGIALCPVCGQVGDIAMTARCNRCGGVLRLPNARASAERSLAWLLAGIILYVPANLLPVMYVSGIGGEGEDTIFEGIVEFWRSGSIGLAALIFCASVAVPLTKFAGLGILIATSLCGTAAAPLSRARLYRFVEFIGYWSMLDVVVVALTSRLVRFGGFAVAEPRPGILFFCGVVILTMLSAFSFDERCIWAPEHAS